MPKELLKSVIVAEHSVESEDGKLLNSLLHVFGHSVSSDELIDDADGSGYKLLRNLWVYCSLYGMVPDLTKGVQVCCSETLSLTNVLHTGRPSV